ncbi:MAG: Ni,Fe-hydrogenase III large subunit [Methylococcaceae bacterium]|nr:Ni,Fe-hydrogenase III large subunit [Methylococcaceae bacterium]
MNPITGIDAYHAFGLKLAEAGLPLRSVDPSPLAPAKVLELAPTDWGKAAAVARAESWRWAGVWAEDCGPQLTVQACLEKQGCYVLLHTAVDSAHPVLPSHTHSYWAAERPERQLQDMFGLRFEDHPDPRRWARHQAWGDTEHPLRKDYPVAGTRSGPTPPDKDYAFLRAHGPSVYEIPVGPVHAGIIEPGHFRFLAVGETVLHLEERLGYVHKGIEKIAEGRDPQGLARLAGRVSGDSTVGHAWAACMAMERAARIEIPARAASLRAIFAERERVINHLWDLAARCNDVGFAFGYYQFGRLREQWLRENREWFGHRLLMDRIVPGGVATDLASEAAAKMGKTIVRLRRELDELLTILDANSSLEDRFLGAGVLSAELAAALGALGFVGRSSGQSFDVRRDAPYAPYDRLEVRVPVETQGDVSSRFWVRYKELRAALRLLESLLVNLPAGEIAATWGEPPADAQGFAAVEGWRGEILAFVRFATDNRIARYWPRDPSTVNWPALEKLVLGNIVPDFPVCNKSVNGSYSGHDL